MPVEESPLLPLSVCSCHTKEQSLLLPAAPVLSPLSSPLYGLSPPVHSDRSALPLSRRQPLPSRPSQVIPSVYLLLTALSRYSLSAQVYRSDWKEPYSQYHQ